MTLHKRPGIILIFDDEIWYHKVDAYADIQAQIDNIKYALVDPVNSQRVLAGATKLDSNDALEMLNVEKDDVQELLLKGITIRPLGR
jgi:hypothetical protein